MNALIPAQAEPRRGKLKLTPQEAAGALMHSTQALCVFVQYGLEHPPDIPVTLDPKDPYVETTQKFIDFLVWCTEFPAPHPVPRKVRGNVSFANKTWERMKVGRRPSNKDLRRCLAFFEEIVR